MCLVMAVVSPQRALLLSDGFVMSAGKVLRRDASKIFQLPSGDRLLVTGSDEGIRFTRSLQRAEAQPATVVADRIQEWGSTHRQPNYFGLIGRNGNRLSVWRGRLSVDGWEDFLREDFSGGLAPVVLCDGYFGITCDEQGIETDTPFRDEIRIQTRLIATKPNFDVAAGALRSVFDKICLAAPERIGGAVFIDHMHAGDADGIASGWDSAAQKTNAVDSNGNILLKNKSVALGTTSSPTTTNLSFSSDVPEMSITVTTKGNSVLISFYGTFLSADGSIVKFRLFRDSGFGTVIGNDVIFSGTGQVSIALIAVDSSPSAASHTYHVGWEVTNGGNTATAQGTSRQMQVVELG
jgi:hypothetical protein